METQTNFLASEWEDLDSTSVQINELKAQLEQITAERNQLQDELKTSRQMEGGLRDLLYMSEKEIKDANKTIEILDFEMNTLKNKNANQTNELESKLRKMKDEIMTTKVNLSDAQSEASLRQNELNLSNAELKKSKRKEKTLKEQMDALQSQAEFWEELSKETDKSLRRENACLKACCGNYTMRMINLEETIKENEITVNNIIENLENRIESCVISFDKRVRMYNLRSIQQDKDLEEMKNTLLLNIKTINLKNQTINDLEKIIGWDASTHESKDKIINELLNENNYLKEKLEGFNELQSEASLWQNESSLWQSEASLRQSDTDIMKAQLSAMNSWCQYYSNMYSALYTEYSKLQMKEKTSTEAQTNSLNEEDEVVEQTSLLGDIMSMIKGIYNKCDSIDERTRRIEQTDQNPNWQPIHTGARSNVADTSIFYT